MRYKYSISMIAIALVSMGVFTIPNAQSQTATAAKTVVYNLYATDAFVKMADETVVYNYGFVGGRSSGQNLLFQKSFSADGNSGGDNNNSFTNGFPTPSGGILTANEFKLQGNAQFPAPLIYATTSDVVQINLKNLGTTNPGSPNDPHSIHLHGLDVNAANDGVPETSIGAIPANLCSDGSTAPAGQNCATPAPGAGNVIVYMFNQKNDGTYFYHCHQEADIHVQMGMYGALVMYNPTDAAAATGPGTGKGGTIGGWKYDKDYVLLESELDVRQHCSEQGTYLSSGLCSNPGFGYATLPGQPDGWNPVDYHPQYWFLNGLSFPNTVHVGGGPVKTTWADWIAAHPGYDPLITGSISTAHSGFGTTRGDKILIRMINMGFETQPMHMHGYHGKVIGSDQRTWLFANIPLITPFGQGLEKQTLTIGSGESYEWLIDIGQQARTSTYPTGTQTRYDSNNAPRSNTSGGSVIPLNGDSSETLTYIGGPTVKGTVIGDPINSGSQWFPFHNHDDYKATNNGVYPGGMFTMIVPLP